MYVCMYEYARTNPCSHDWTTGQGGRCTVPETMTPTVVALEECAVRSSHFLDDLMQRQLPRQPTWLDPLPKSSPLSPLRSPTFSHAHAPSPPSPRPAHRCHLSLLSEAYEAHPGLRTETVSPASPRSHCEPRQRTAEGRRRRQLTWSIASQVPRRVRAESPPASAPTSAPTSAPASPSASPSPSPSTTLICTTRPLADGVRHHQPPRSRRCSTPPRFVRTTRHNGRGRQIRRLRPAIPAAAVRPTAIRPTAAIRPAAPVRPPGRLQLQRRQPAGMEQQPALPPATHLRRPSPIQLQPASTQRREVLLRRGLQAREAKVQ